MSVRARHGVEAARVAAAHDGDAGAADTAPPFSRRRLAAALDASMEGLAILSGDVYAYLNPAHARMYGYDDPAELIGRSWKTIYDADEVERIEREVMPVLAAEGHWRGRTVGRARDGARVDGEIHLTISPDGDLVCTCVDISPVIRLTDALLAERRWHATVLEAANAGAWAWDLESNTMHANPAYVAMLGGWNLAGERDAAALTRERLHPDDFAALEQRFWQPERQFGLDARVRWPDGSEHLLTFRGRALHDTGGGDGAAPTTLAGVCWDRTAELEIERLRNELISVVCHELRTPLTSLRGFAELMLGNDFPRDRQQHFLRIMLREAMRTSELLNEFLAVQRAESLDKAPANRPTDLADCIRNAVDSVALVESDRARTQIDVDAAAGCVSADAGALVQVLINLLSNAFKFSEAPAPVCVSTRRTGERVAIEIRDEGMGIHPREHGLVFEKFYRSPEVEAASIPGTGLGLPLVKRLTETMGGAIELESSPGAGTTVRILLDAADAGGSVAQNDSGQEPLRLPSS